MLNHSDGQLVLCHPRPIPSAWPSTSLHWVLTLTISPVPSFDLTLTITPVTALQICPCHHSCDLPQPRPHHHSCPFRSPLHSPSPLTVLLSPLLLSFSASLSSPSLLSTPAALSSPSLLSPPAALSSPPPHHRQTSPPEPRPPPRELRHSTARRTLTCKLTERENWAN